MAAFRKLYFVFGSNSCELSAVLGSKSCFQVFERCRAEEGNLVSRSQIEESLTLNNQKNEENEEENESENATNGERANFDQNNSQKRGRRKRKRVSLKSSKQKLPRPSKGLPPNFSPCDHPGPCSAESNCLCAVQNRQCEKFCGCGKSCPRQFSGCQCRVGRCQTRNCACFSANRECDPDKCFTCESSIPPKEVESIGDGGKFASDERFCQNVPLQSGIRKRLFLGRSTIHGWGAFCLDGAKKGELITEYVGELISQDEADRRGKIYDKLNRSYLFNLNEEFVVDAARKGNEIRYANHSETPNCFSRVMSVVGDHRIGIYAKRKIRPGEELFFHYQHEHAGSEPTWFMEVKGGGAANKHGNQNEKGEQEEDEEEQTREQENIGKRHTAKKNSH